MIATPRRAMPTNTPEQLSLRSFVFQYLEGVLIQNWCAYRSGGVQKIRICILALGAVKFFFLLPASGGDANSHFYNTLSARVSVFHGIIASVM